MNNLLEVTDLCVEFKTSRGTVQALGKVNIHVKKGETLGIVGESGCGKSITALSLMNLLPKQTGRISGGSILFDGQEIVGLSEKKMRRQGTMVQRQEMFRIQRALSRS